MTKEQYQQFCILQANYWIASATTKHCCNSNIVKFVNNGYDEPTEIQLTDEEKISDAMKIAQQHINNYMESCEQ